MLQDFIDYPFDRFKSPVNAINSVIIALKKTYEKKNIIVIRKDIFLNPSFQSTAPFRARSKTISVSKRRVAWDFKDISFNKIHVN